MSGCVDHSRKGYGIGYATAWVQIDGQKKPTTLHRKVFLETYGYLPEVVRHSCDNPRCINPAHLQAGTQLDNVRDMHERGRAGDCRNFGKTNGRAVLSDAEVQQIRAEYVKGSRLYGLPALAAKYGVGTSQIHRIVKGMQRA